MSALQAAPVTACYRHPQEHAGVRCQRCDKHICPDCMTVAPVGFHCPDCIKSGRQRIIRVRALFQSRPVLSETLLALNLLAFAIGMVMAAPLDPSTNPTLIPHALLGLFSLDAGPIRYDTEAYRLVTSGFLHIGLLHLGVNMVALCQLGPMLERRLGPLRFGLLYLASLLGGSLGHILVAPEVSAAGASGALFGLAGALLADERYRGIDITRSDIGIVMIANGAITVLMPGISIGGHAGGFVFGYLAGLALFVAPKIWRRGRHRAAIPVVLALCVVAVVASLVACGGVAVPRFL